MATQKSFEKVVSLVAFLRSKEGCPWDQEQTFASLAPIIIEEVYEVVEALEEQDMEALQEELGDLLWDLIFVAQIAADKHHFTVFDICSTLAEKIVRRHPHVWGEHKTNDMEQIGKLYDAVKHKDYGAKRPSPFDGIVKAQPALMRALKTVKKAQKAHIDFEESPEVATLVEGFDKELWGALLFQLTIQSRKQKIDLEAALRTYTDQFTKQHGKGVEKTSTKKSKPVK